MVKILSIGRKNTNLLCFNIEQVYLKRNIFHIVLYLPATSTDAELLQREFWERKQI